MALRVTRRSCLKSTGASLLATGFIGSVNASSHEVTLSGKIEAHDGSPTAGRRMYISNDGSSEYVDIDENGYFEVDVSAESRAGLAFYKSGTWLHAPVRNEVPHIDGIGKFDIGSEDKDLGTIRLPKAYLVTLRALDSDGNPATDAEFGFGADGYGSGVLYADDEGYCVIGDADFRGVELAESASVGITIPADDGSSKLYRESIYVSNHLIATAREGEGMTIQNANETSTPSSTPTSTPSPSPTATASPTPTPTSVPTDSPTSTPTATNSPTETMTSTPTMTVTKTPISDSDTPENTDTSSSPTFTPTAESDNRGFFSNTGDSFGSDFLSDPRFLTVGGFVLSVVGILGNLMRRT